MANSLGDAYRTTILDRAALGASLLDKVLPGWAALLDFDHVHCAADILSQLWPQGGKAAAEQALGFAGPQVDDLLAAHGFLLGPSVPINLHARLLPFLIECWQQEVRARIRQEEEAS